MKDEQHPAPTGRLTNILGYLRIQGNNMVKVTMAAAAAHEMRYNDFQQATSADGRVMITSQWSTLQRAWQCGGQRAGSCLPGGDVHRPEHARNAVHAGHQVRHLLRG